MSKKVWNSPDMIEFVEQLDRSPPNFEKLFGLLPDMVVVTTLGGEIVSGNRAFTHILGWDDDDIRSAQALDFVAEPDRDAMARSMLDLVAGGNVPPLIVRMPRKGGGYVWVEWVGKRYEDYLYGTGRNVTALRREAQLVAAEQRILRGVVDRRPLRDLLDEVCRSLEDLIPDMNGCVMILDRGAERLRLTAGPSLPPDLGVLLATVRIGPDVGSCGEAVYNRRRIISCDPAPDCGCETLRGPLLAEGIRSCWSTPLLDADGAALGTLSLMGREPRTPEPWELEIADRLSNATAIAIERQRTDEALAAATSAAEAASRAKSQFIASMSHELRTPLNAVIGFADFIINQERGPLGEADCIDAARDIRSAGEHLLRVINDILDLSKIEAGFMDLVEEKVDLAAEVRAGIRMTRPAAEAARITVTLEPGAALPRLRGEARRIRQVVLNLLSNAINHTPPGGRVTVTILRCGDGAVALRVEDTGIGIAPEDIRTALEPFGQVDSYRKATGQGTGLGLPVSQRLMEMHGGTLDLASTPGVGTVVTVTFPVGRVLA